MGTGGSAVTLCPKRHPMVIRTTLVDFGEGETELEIEACLECRLLYVGPSEWTVEGA